MVARGTPNAEAVGSSPITVVLFSFILHAAWVSNCTSP